MNRTVAQVFNLPYRRFVIGRTLLAAGRWRVKNLRYSRLQVCATGAASTLNKNRVRSSGRLSIGPLWTLMKLALFFAAGPLALAERYLSVVEAQKVCFPQADHFEARTVRLTPEQSRAIEQKAGVKVRDREVRIWLAHQGTNLLGVLVLDHVFGKHDLIDYAVALSPEAKVLQVEILEYREHYGSEIRAPKWREQFKGKSASSKLKLNDDIYNISGATISCRNVSEGVRRVLATFELVLRPGLAPGNGLPNTRAVPP